MRWFERTCEYQLNQTSTLARCGTISCPPLTGLWGSFPITMVAGYLSLQQQLHLMAKKFQATSRVASPERSLFHPENTWATKWFSQNRMAFNKSPNSSKSGISHSNFTLDLYCSSLWQAVQVATQNDMRKHTCHRGTTSPWYYCI